MPNWFPSGDTFFGPGTIRIFLGVSFGFLSHKIRFNANNTFRSRLASLSAAPTFPLSSLKLHPITDQGQLVLLQNGVVSPLSNPLFSSSGRKAVLLKTADYTDQPKDFNCVYQGTRVEKFSRVPFALAEKRNGGGFRVAVVNANEKHLPLEIDSSSKSALDPPVSLTSRITLNRFFVEKTEKSASIRVSKVKEESVLGFGTRLDNVFGRLKLGSNNGLGFPEIEPCTSFPDECFTMSKSEIESKVEFQATAMRGLSVVVGIVSMELLFSGIRSRLNSTK